MNYPDIYQGQNLLLEPQETALFSFIGKQKTILLSLVGIMTIAFAINWHFTLQFLLAVVTFLYFLDVVFNIFLVFRSLTSRVEIYISEEEIKDLDQKSLPRYTILCPLYKEAEVLPQFVSAMKDLDYPKNKLQILLLLEEDDIVTLQMLREIELPKHFQPVMIPNSLPKTKPKAMNYALSSVKGKYVVIYDAEDIPDPLQLKKAVVAFKKAAPNTICVQAKLNFYNSKQNILTKIFTAEYSLWFDLILPGLQSINAPIPLGGTSNHFVFENLKDLKGWDPFNVTEDCDLGIRLSAKGYRTAIFSSTTWEEANSEIGNWFNQRSRWLKGYMQTYLVHVRRWRSFLENNKFINFMFFQLTVGGKVLSSFLNPLMWVVTIFYFLFRPYVGDFIDSFFSAPVLYLAVFSFIFGNFFALYNYMIGCAKRGFDGLIKYTFLIPFYWLGMSLAAWRALFEIIFRPHYWAKTKHGLHLKFAKSKNG